MSTLRFAATEAWYEFCAGCRGPLIPIAFPGLIAYLMLVLLNADYLRDMGATDVPRNSPHLVYLMIAGQAVWLLFVWAWLFGQVVARDRTASLHALVLLMLGAFVGLYLAALAQRYLLSWVGQKVLADLRAALFRHLQELPLSYHDNHIVGVTISRVISDVGVINQLLSQGLIRLTGDSLLLAGIVIVMLSLNAQLALVTFAIIPLIVLATMLFARRAKRAFRKSRARNASMIGDLAEDLSGIRVIQAFAKEGSSFEKFDEVNQANRDAHIEAISLSFVFLPTVEFLSMTATAIVLLFGGLSVAGGHLTLGTVIAFLAYVNRFFLPVQELSPLRDHADGPGRRRAGDKPAAYRAERQRPPRGAAHAADTRAYRLSRRRLQLSARAAGPARYRPGDSRRHDAGPGRADRGRQDLAGEFDCSLLRCQRRRAAH